MHVGPESVAALKIDLITFDCAKTLVDVDWNLGRFVGECATSVGLELPDEHFSLYETMFAERLTAFIAANMAKDAQVGEVFWRDLTRDWLVRVEADTAFVMRLREASDHIAFGAESRIFNLYPDVVPCLDWLDSVGIRAAIVSNWDYSLHRVIRMFGIYDRFATVIASLEEGVEKPDPRLMSICLSRLGADPARTVHVGDDPLDDVQGARNASILPVRIDRVSGVQRMSWEEDPEVPVIQSLLELPEVLRSIA